MTVPPYEQDELIEFADEPDLSENPSAPLARAPNPAATSKQVSAHKAAPNAPDAYESLRNAAIADVSSWPILVVDDDPDVHHATKFSLSGYTFLDRPIEVIDAYSAYEAEAIVRARSDIAVLVLDVVMESSDAGLQLVTLLRHELRQIQPRIILRTGQPGEAPEQTVIQSYDINDYKSKSELNHQQLINSITTCLRSYVDMRAMAYAHSGQSAAEARDMAKSQFIATISHEIRTPMNGIISMADLIFDKTQDRELKNLTGIIRTSADNLLAIINDILDFSKMEAGRMTLESGPLNIGNVVESVINLLGDVAQEKELEISIDIAPGITLDRTGDAIRLRQVLINLVGNAIKFTNEGHIGIRVTPGVGDDDPGKAQNRVRFEVTDTGIGIAPEARNLLFQAFEQLDTGAHRQASGTGLGLAISRRLVRMMDGHMDVESILGQGSTFWFDVDLPVDTLAPEQTQPLLGTRFTCWSPWPAVTRGNENLVRRLGGEIVSEADFRALDVSARKDIALLIDVPVSAHEQRHQIDMGLAELHAGLCPIFMAARGRPRPDALANAVLIEKPFVVSTLTQAILGVLGRNYSQTPVPDEAEVQGMRTIPAIAASGLKTLVVEDNKTNQLVMEKLMKTLGLPYELAENGRVALELFQKNRYCMILTDYHMPVMDGIELTKAIRTIEAAPKGPPRTPIIMLTADILSDTLEDCSKAGTDGHLTKPITLGTLKGALETHGRNCGAALSDPNASEDHASDMFLFDGDETGAKSSASRAAGSEDTIATIDLDYVKETMDVIGDDFWDIVDSFLSNTPARLTDIQKTQDPHDIKKLAHTIAGAARSVGATSLAAHAKSLEALGHAGNLPDDADISALTKAYDIFTRAMSERRALGR